MQPAQSQAGASQGTPPAFYCPSCNSQAQWLPNGQLWCSRCSAAVVVGGDTVGAGRYILSFFLAGFIGLAVQYFLRYRGWLATWINLAIFTLTVIGTVALLAAAASSCYYDAYGNYICP
jgi:hypothetical protein